MKKALTVTMVLMIFVSVLAVIPSMNASPTLQDDINTAIDTGLAWLHDHQETDGRWDYTWGDVGATGLAVLSYIHHYGSYAALPADYKSDVDDAISYILGKQLSDGSFYDMLKTYETAVAIMALNAMTNPSFNDEIEDARDWLITNQNDGANKYYGGWYYHDKYADWSDLSNTHFAIMGLKVADTLVGGVPSSTWDDAETFVSRCQNDATLNPHYYTRDDGGGFVYMPSDYDNPDTGYSMRESSYGSMTGAGVWSLLLIPGIDTSDPRVSTGLSWLTTNFDATENVGSEELPSDPDWYYYYYAWAVAKAFIMAGIDPDATDPSNWYYQLASHLVYTKQVTDPLDPDFGSWVPASPWEYRVVATELALLVLEKSIGIVPPRSITKTLGASDGQLGDVVHVTLKVTIPSGETATVVDTLPVEWKYITGTFQVDGVSATPTVTTTPPPPPRSEVISYSVTTSGTYTIEFDVKVTKAYWEDRTVTNRAVATWYDELGNIVEVKEATADFVIHAFEQLHKTVGTSKKVKVIPAPVQFWRQFIGGVKDIIVSDPPGWPEPVALVRDYAILHNTDDDPFIPLERLTWPGTEKLVWERIDKEGPYVLSPGEVAVCYIYTDETTSAVLVRYTVAWNSTRDVIETHFVNEAILENSSPQVIVGQLSNFDVHNDYHEPVDNFELELYGIQPSDIVAWFPGWGTPPQITSIPGGTEIMWMGPSVLPCQWVHFGLHLKPDVIATGVKAYWTQILGATLTIKEKTNVQWALVFEVTNPFPYTMTNVVVTDRFGAELEIDSPFPYSITHGWVSYTTRGMSQKIFLTWNIGNLLPGVTARLVLLVSTDYNPGRGDCNEDNLVNTVDICMINAHWTSPSYQSPLGYDRNADINDDDYINTMDIAIVNSLWGQSVTGHQEYTQPGVYEMNSGATLKFIDPEQNMQLSAVTAPIYVTVLPAEDP